MGWIIESETERDDESGFPLVWSNAEGFTASDNFETYSDNERETLSLPVGGVWVKVSWSNQ